MKNIRALAAFAVIVLLFAAAVEGRPQKDKRQSKRKSKSQSAAVQYSSATAMGNPRLSDAVRVGNMLDVAEWAYYRNTSAET